MVDRSTVRRNKPCWYMVEDVQTVAVNDSLLIENACYHLLKLSFGHLPCYARMVDMFHETAMTTFIGQSADFLIAKTGITEFTMEKHVTMSNYKTSHTAFYAPVALPMILAG